MSTPTLSEYFHATAVAPAQMDALWAQGWRHFGDYFFRYNRTVMDGTLQEIIALRTDLHSTQMSKSQRRIWRRNRDLQVQVRPAHISAEKIALFEQHKERFVENVPSALAGFLGDQPNGVPCPCAEVAVYDPHENRLLAVSFLDVGQTAVSSIYALFDPTENQRGLGLYTMLLEMVWAKRQGKKWYYTGYTTIAPSRYDYKKAFHGLHAYDFANPWRPFPRFGGAPSPSEP